MAYWPKNYKGKKSTLQSRNSLIGNYTEKWTTDLIKDLVEDSGLYAVQGVQCNEIGLNRWSEIERIDNARFLSAQASQ